MNATSSDIERAHKRLRSILHPDRNPDPHAAQHFHEVHTAYDTLKDPKKRKQHQMELRQSVTSDPTGLAREYLAAILRNTPHKEACVCQDT
ncbi:MAG: DnaJ domain-containing protein [Candidatus Pacebacteria bacterium]|nr:DnaJ domain-containing protein [Candidatus Paceibacterota bacterium]